MTDSNDTKSKDPRAMLSSVISTGKAAVSKIGATEIKNFIASQEGIEGEVQISNLRSNSDVGASSGIVMFTAEYTSDGAPVNKELVLRHAPNSETRLFFEYDMERQFRVQQALRDSRAMVPDTLWLDDGSNLGTPGFIMGLSSGNAPGPSAFAAGPLAEASAKEREKMLQDVMQNQVAIHQTDLKSAGLEDFSMNAEGNTPMECCINWYWQTWCWIKIPAYKRLVPVHHWLLENAPDGTPELTHGDSSLHNYLFENNQVTGVLDWEMSCIGRAETDLALQCITNQLFAAPKESGALQPPSEQQWLQWYADAGGRPVENFSYFKKLAAYFVVVAVSALQRNMSAAEQQSQAPLLSSFWNILES